MHERLEIRRDRFRENIRKEHHQTMLRKKRVELIGVMEEGSTCNSLLAAIRQEQGSPFNLQLLSKLLEHTVREDTEKSYILVGNYLLDHPKMGLPIAFEFYQTRNSKCGYFAWVVRLLLMTPDVSNYEIYIHQISTFLTGNDKAFKYGIGCLEYLIEKEQYDAILTLQNIDYVVRNLSQHPDRYVRRTVEWLVIRLLGKNESGRQRLLISIGINDCLLKLLRSNEFDHRIYCLKSILIVFQSSLVTINSSEIFHELVLLHQADPDLRPLISAIFVACVESLEIVSLCSLLNEGLKNIMCSRLDLQAFDNELLVSTLTLIQAVFRRLTTAEESAILNQLQEYLEVEFSLGAKLQELESDGCPQARDLAGSILSSFYDFEESLLNA